MIKLQEETSSPGIWKFSQALSPLEKKFWLTLDEGSTPVAKKGEVFFKREDFNPTGSLKDRGMAFQISQSYQEGRKDLVISSSGNAAISAAAFCSLSGINLHAFVSQKIQSQKLAELKKFKPKIYLSGRSVSDSIKFAKKNGYKNLRPSIDKFGPEGYKTIAFELFKQVGRFNDLFLPVSSATALVGIAQGFKLLGFMPRFHACQSTMIFTIAGFYDQDFSKTATSLASSLVARLTPRNKEAREIISRSQGTGWVISDQEIKKALAWLKNQGIITSFEGGLSLAAIWKANSKGFKTRKTVCLLTGKNYE